MGDMDERWVQINRQEKGGRGVAVVVLAAGGGGVDRGCHIFKSKKPPPHTQKLSPESCFGELHN